MSALTHWLALQGFPGPQARHSNGDTPLMRAAWQGEDAIVLALLAGGADAQLRAPRPRCP